MNSKRVGGPDFGIRLVFLLIDSGMLVVTWLSFSTSSPSSEGHFQKFLMFLTVLGLTVTAAVGVIRKFALHFRSSAESSEAIQND
jgi:hypothetical protein